jgi:hypothetical protein
MTTLASLRTQCRDVNGDSAGSVWGDSQIDNLINAAIRDISTHFPRLLSASLACSRGTRAYDLPDTLISVVSVEHPAGDDPPAYLLRRAYTHPRFWSAEGYYDVVATQTTDASNPPQLYISAQPADGESIAVSYYGEHNALSDSGDVTTILERHEHLIALFVRWKCWSELALTEGADPDPIKLLSATQEVNAYRAERAYRKALAEAKAAESQAAVSSPWRMDKWDRGY